jgi:hypothetical protein
MRERVALLGQIDVLTAEPRMSPSCSRRCRS